MFAERDVTKVNAKLGTLIRKPSVGKANAGATATKDDEEGNV